MHVTLKLETCWLATHFDNGRLRYVRWSLFSNRLLTSEALGSTGWQCYCQYKKTHTHPDHPPSLFSVLGLSIEAWHPCPHTIQTHIHTREERGGGREKERCWDLCDGWIPPLPVSWENTWASWAPHRFLSLFPPLFLLFPTVWSSTETVFTTPQTLVH